MYGMGRSNRVWADNTMATDMVFFVAGNGGNAPIFIGVSWVGLGMRQILIIFYSAAYIF